MLLIQSQPEFMLLGDLERQARIDLDLALTRGDSEDIMAKTMRRKSGRKSNRLSVILAPAKNSTLYREDPKNVASTIFLVERDLMLTNGEQTENASIRMWSMTLITSAVNEDAIVSKATSGALDVKQVGQIMIHLLKQKVKERQEVDQSVLNIFQCLIIKNCSMLL